MGQFFTFSKNKKLQLPKGSPFSTHSFSLIPHPPIPIIKLHQHGSAFFCPAWMLKVRLVIKVVIRQTGKEELDHYMSPSSNEQAKSPYPFPAKPHMKHAPLFI